MKSSAMKHPWLLRRFVSLGQTSHKISSRINVYSSGYKFVGVKPLPEEEALSKATDSVSDFLIYSSAAAIVIIEFVRTERKNAEKAASAARKEKAEMKRIEDRFHELETFVMDIEDVLPATSQTKLNVIRKKLLDDEASSLSQDPLAADASSSIISDVIAAFKF